MSSGVSRVKTGSYIGTGAALTVSTVGFRPSFIQFYNATGLTVCAWSSTMADASAHKLINHDTAQNVVITSAGVTPTATGFTVGTDADLNTSAEIVHWVAFE